MHDFRREELKSITGLDDEGLDGLLEKVAHCYAAGLPFDLDGLLHVLDSLRGTGPLELLDFEVMDDEAEAE